MKGLINSNSRNPHFFGNLFADNEVSKARLQLAFIATLFASSWAIGSVRMGEALVNTHGVSVLATLIGM